MKVVNLPLPVKKGLASKSAKSKFGKKGKDIAMGASKTFSDIVPYKGDFPPIGSIVLESTHPPSTRTRSAWKFTTEKSKPPLLRQPSNAPPSSRTHGNEQKTSPPISSAPSKRKVCYL